jgi:hypothetical protein
MVPAIAFGGIASGDAPSGIGINGDADSTLCEFGHAGRQIVSG